MVPGDKSKERRGTGQASPNDVHSGVPTHPSAPRSAGFIHSAGQFTLVGTVHFHVSPELPEVQAYAVARGWPQLGYCTLSIPWQELHWTIDGWKTVNILKSTDVPSPVVNSYFVLPNVAPGTEVEFAIRVGVACRAEQDTAGTRDVGDFWLNNGGANYRQRAR